MTHSINLHPRPEEDELGRKQAELEILEKVLAEKELELTELRIQLTGFERAYLNKVGVLYAELDEIDARIAEMIARRTPSNLGAQEHARKARAQAQESGSVVDELPQSFAKNFRPSPELKNLYREVARRIHPDLGLNEADRRRRQEFMSRANLAYELGEEARLREILEEYESSPDAVIGEGIAAELVRTIRKIAQVRRRLDEILKEREHLEESDLFQLKAKASYAEKQGRDLLEEMAEDVKSRIESSRKRLDTLSPPNSDI